MVRHVDVAGEQHPPPEPDRPRRREHAATDDAAAVADLDGHAVPLPESLQPGIRADEGVAPDGDPALALEPDRRLQDGVRPEERGHERGVQRTRDDEGGTEVQAVPDEHRRDAGRVPHGPEQALLDPGAGKRRERDREQPVVLDVRPAGADALDRVHVVVESQ